jgi:outer membrane protein
MYRRSQLSKNTNSLAKQLSIALLSLAFIAPTVFTTAFAAETMQVEKALGSQILSDAQALIRKGDFNAAYLLLEPLETERAGEVEYDYLLGVAAVESDHLTRGAFALERVLATDPSHKDARAEMAKAHYLLGETEASKTEFNNVLQQNPDEKTKKNIESLLTAIQKAEGTTTTYAAYLDFGLGWDSNVSSVPNITSIAVPIFGGTLQLGNTALAKSDNFANLAAGISFRHPFTKQFSVFGGVGGTNHLNGSETAFDNSTLDFNAGLQYVQDKNNLTFALQDNHFDLDSEGFRHAYGGSAQWLYNINAYNQAGVYAQYTRLNYTGNSSRNSDRAIVGINAAHAFQGDSKPVIFASYYGGRDVARHSDENSLSPLSQDILGIRAGGQLNFNDKWQLFSTFSYELRENDRKNIIFSKIRKDNQYDAALGLRYSPARDWTIKPQISYSKNDSNIELNSYDRSIVSINVRKDFSW